MIKTKFWSIFFSLTLLVAISVEYGLATIALSNFDTSLLPKLIDAGQVPFGDLGIYLMICIPICISGWFHCKNVSFRIRSRYQKAYRSYYMLYDAIIDQASKVIGRERSEQASPSKNFRPSLLNKQVDCGRYRMKDQTLSPRVVVKLPTPTHFNILWFSLKKTIIDPVIYWELGPLLLIPVALAKL